METEGLNILWIIIASSLVFLMQAGFALVESGLTRSKNSINVSIKNLTDLGVSTLGYWAIGFALMFGASKTGMFGGSFFFFEPFSTWSAVFFIFHMMFCSTSATIVSGAVAERMRYSSYIISTLFLSLLIYPVFGHWVWGGSFLGGAEGWLNHLGFVDFAGSTVVHSLGGWVALAILLIIGPRSGLFQKDGRTREINGSNIPMVVLGVIILWFGWFGFNGGSTLALNGTVPLIILRTTLSAASGMIGTLAIGWPIRKKPDVTLVMNGALAGLVAITAAVHAVTSLEAIFIGLIGGGVMFVTEEWLKKIKIDDAVSAIPVHLSAGIWGTLAVALFGDPRILDTGLSFWAQLGVQALGIVACGVWAFTVAFLFLFILNKKFKLRVTLEDEQKGLNVAEHGVSTEILDLYITMDAQTRTGDLKLRAPVEPFTEAGQIASMYNRVMDSLEVNTIEKGAYLDILQNVNDGMFLLLPDGTIGHYYSSALESIFQQKRIGGRKFFDLLNPYLDQETQNVLPEFLNICFNHSIPWRNCVKLNPLRETSIELDNGKGTFIEKHLSFSFKRIEKETTVSQLLVLVRDETRQKELSMELEQARRDSRTEIELLYKILHIDPAMMKEYLTNLEYDLDQINQGFQNPEGGLRDNLEATFRHCHAIKGDSELLQIEFIAEKAEELELKIQSLLRKDTIQAEDYLPLTLMFSDLKKTAMNVQNLLNRWFTIDFHTGLEQKNELDKVATDKDTQFRESIDKMVTRLGREYEKVIQMDFNGDILVYAPEKDQKKIKDIIIQLIRNAVFHGIEEPEVRIERGKEPAGTITLSSSFQQGTLQIQVIDDGRGINKANLKEKGISSGLLSLEQKNISNEDIVRLLFTSGISTAREPDRIAGKGIGMDMVKSLIQELNGSIKIKSKLHEFCGFTVSIPLN